ncbi:hypothetical protein QBC39DRAFT_176461 [Podospora conica]|nr:hypothetical protein QBC39DRAFT_176461 [Schizothecium conicum]
MLRLFRPRWLVSRLRGSGMNSLQPAPRAEAVRLRVVTRRQQIWARRAGTLAAGSLAIYAFVSLADRYSELQGFDDEMLIPLPFTTTSIPSEPYGGSDPEWREFVKIARDTKAVVKIKRDLAENVARLISLRILVLVASSPVETQMALLQKWGRVAKLKSYAFHIDFPLYPPPEVGSLCITVDDENIALNRQQVDPATQEILDRICWPWATAQALWVTSTIIFKRKTSPGTQALATEGPSGAPGNIGPSNGGGGVDVAEREEIQSPRPKRNTIRVPLSLEDAALASFGPDRTRTLTELVARNTAHPKDVFFRTYLFHRPTSDTPPRGSFCVRGMVNLETEVAVITVGVRAWYDPKTGLFDRSSMSLQLDRMQPLLQRPLRH